MSQSMLLIISINIALGIATLISALYCFVVCRKLNALKKINALYKNNRNTLPQETFDHPIMKYSEYKKEFGSRSRDIALILPSKQEDITEIITEFTEAMRENGTLLYHFTNYWGAADQKETQRIITEVMHNNYHGIFTVGTTITKLAKNLSLTHNKLTPIVFAQVNEAAWQREQDKTQPVYHMTGCTLSDNWRYRLKMYLYVKPFMRSVLIPITSPSVQESASAMVDILRSYGVNAHAIATHSGDDLIQTLSLYVDEIDSLILTRDILPAEIISKVAKKCSENKITFFSPFLKDVHLGAAVSMNTVDEHFGLLAAKQMITILENGTAPGSIELIKIGESNPYEIHFNQIAMQTQGLDIERITTFALQFGNKLYTSIDKDLE
jgi:ABC-type uncharacterized transport system substrate-binding protein